MDTRIQSIIDTGIAAGYAVTDAYLAGRISQDQATSMQSAIQIRMDYLLNIINNKKEG